jgi:hypothetical protein
MPDCINDFALFWRDGMMFEIKIAILTAIVVPISLIVTFMTPPTSKEKLESFYRKVRPGGFWSVLEKDVRNLPGKAISFSTIVDVAGGMMLCYGLSLAIGFAILLKFSSVFVCLTLAAVGTYIVIKWFRKEVKILQNIREGSINSTSID